MEHTIYDLEKLEYQVKEYQQRTDRPQITAIFIDDKPLVRRDRVVFTCKKCKKEITISPENFASRKGEKICKSCSLSKMRINLDTDLIKKLYIEKRMSASDIAELLNTTKKNIFFRLKRMNIERRKLSEAAEIRMKAHPKSYPGDRAYLGMFGNSKGSSKPEQYMKALLEEKEIKFVFQKHATLCNSKIKVFDFWLPDYNTFIEVDGDYWHYNKDNPKIACRKPNAMQKRKTQTDKEKNEYCRLSSINLIRIWESELEEKAKEILEELK